VNATDRLLAGVRRRLQLGWLVDAAQAAAPFVAAGALLLVLLGWLAPWGWPEPTALVVVAVSLIALVGATLFVKVSVEMAARAADRSLGVKDAFTAALQFRDNEKFGTEIVARAERFATDTTPRQAVPWKSHPKRWAAAALLGIAALTLALVANPQDDERARAAETADVLEEEAEELEATAESIRELEEPTDAELAVAAQLEQLADELRELDELSEAESLLRDASTELSPDASALFSTKAAVQGLNRSLEAQPLPGASGDAAEQLDQLAANLDGLGEAEQEELADRLDALAATQGAGNPAAGAALADAAAALRAGEAAGAEAALGEAAGAQRAGEGEVREGQVGQAASAAAGDAANRVEGQQGQGQGGGEGQGQGEGEANGQSGGEDGSGNGGGEGDGDGNGGGQGGGQGSGQGGDGSGGNPSGDVGGASGGDNASGQGGQGQINGSGDSTETGNEADNPTLFDPGGETDELFPGGSGTGDSETVGLGQGPTTSGGSQVPLSDALGDYERQAVAALADPSVAPSQRALVQRYFDRLAGLSGSDG